MAAYVTCGRVQRGVTHGGQGALRGLPALVLSGLALLGLAACGKAGGGGSDEMSWAQAALQRNDRIEIVATDPATSTFTVRVKATGELQTVRADQVTAGPPGLAASAAATATSATAPNTEPGQAAAGGQAPAQNSPTEPASPTNSMVAQSNGAADAAGATARQADAGSTVPRTGLQSSAAPAAEVPNPNSDVTSITPGGRVLESGPGYAIKVASGARSSPQVTARAERISTTGAIERRHDPIICQGQRMLHIDNRNLEFDGDAIAAQDGCEIYITNSHLIARNGVGVSARHALVHIDNSQIEGDSASIDASEGAQVYLQSSSFKGVSRRLDNASFHDLGGNVWN